MSIVVKCKAIKEMFQNGLFRIIAFEPYTPINEELKLSEYFTFSVKGEIPYITIGKEYDLEIELISYDKRYGGSYKILSVLNLEKLDLHDLTREESFEILMDCTSSEKIANNILDAYPNFIEAILINGKESINVKLIKGVGEVYLNAYSRELINKYKYYHIIQKFKDYKIDISDAKILCDNYKDEFGIEKAIKNNPYKSLKELGRSFENSDKIIMELRPELKQSEERCAYLILSILERNEYDGNTRLNGNILYNYIENEYNVPELLSLVVKVATENNLLFYYDKKSKDLAIASTYFAECRISEFLKNKINNSTKLDIDWEKYKTVENFTMSEMQSKALKMFCESSIMILAGYSGSGKTTSIKGLISLFENNHLSYTLLAPTGKASKKITEQLNKNRNITASTIHKRVLKDGNINSDVIIIDEMSMVDLPTFILLLNSISNENARIIFVGDPAQLTPVGIACIFNDMIKSNKIPMIMLTEIFRYNTNGGLFVATNVRQGKKFFDSEEVDDKGNKIVKWNDNICTVCNNYKFIQTDKIFDIVINEYNKLINKGIKSSDILCLSPFNVGSDGTYALNNAIQKEINPLKPNEKILTREIQNNEISFKLGDRVLNKKNDYEAITYELWETMEKSNGVLSKEDIELLSIFNGQDGVIRQIDDKKIIIQFDEDLIVFDKLKLKNLLLAYAISVHSSQGSESLYVINIVSPLHKKMLNRNLLYVADTRSKIKQIDVGDMNTYNEALLIDGVEERNTWLKDLLMEESINA